MSGLLGFAVGWPAEDHRFPPRQPLGWIDFCSAQTLKARQKLEKPPRQAAFGPFLYRSGEGDLHGRRDGHRHATALHPNFELAGLCSA